MSISTQPDLTEFNAAILLVGKWSIENRRQKTSERGRRRIGGQEEDTARVQLQWIVACTRAMREGPQTRRQIGFLWQLIKCN